MFPLDQWLIQQIFIENLPTICQALSSAQEESAMKERSEEKNKERSESYLCGVCILISIVLTPVKKIKENDKRMI